MFCAFFSTVLDPPIDGLKAIASSAIAPGQPIYLKADGHCALANAASLQTASVAGLAVSFAAAGEICKYENDGFVKADWSEVVGEASLAVGTCWYLDWENPGKLRYDPPPPTLKTPFKVKVGLSISDRQMAVEIGEPVSVWNRQEKISASQTLEPGVSYLIENSNSSIELLLPEDIVTSVADKITITHKGVAPFRVVQRELQSIIVGNKITTPGIFGKLESIDIGLSIVIEYTGSSTWIAKDLTGYIDVI